MEKTSGVLVAISIPIFTSQLEKSRDAVTLSNLRAAYAQAQTAVLTESDDGNAVYTKNADGTQKVEFTPVTSKGTAEGLNGLDELDWLTAAERTTLAAYASLGGTPKDWKITFNYDASGNITSVTAS